MASAISHPAVPIAIAVIAIAVGRKIISLPLLLTGIAFSMVPDADSLGFQLGVPYASPFGHRGFSHSIAIALFCALLLVPLARMLKATPAVLFGFLFASMLSHGMLDAMTDQGNGVAFLWPFDNHRFFFGFRPIEASPIDVRQFMSGRGLEILYSEFLWI
ncbi:MAG TPA: metal-dependent hydrolase, partial [Steroidobacteraceae bacterium]|nr:metal-dependent hydrolase [Steroidobacteraceae bacterium]